MDAARTSATAPATLADLAFREGRRLAADPNICAVGYGAKLRGGAHLPGGSIIYYVRDKLATTAEVLSRGSWLVPDSLDGFNTDVIGVGNLVAASADRHPAAGIRGTRVAAPLVGGPATAGLGTSLGGPGGYGTIGGLCFDTATNAPLVLSNAHVWGAAGTEVIQPVTASGMFGATVTPAVLGDPPSLVQTRLLPALAAPIAFANAVAQTYLITGGDTDPLPAGQAATAVPDTTRTDSEQVSISAPNVGLPPAGRRLSPTVAWSYQRLSTTSVLEFSVVAPQTVSKLLAARRLFTDKITAYSSGQVVNLYAEIVPTSDGGPALASAHFPVALLYPLPAGDRVIPRLLRPCAKQTPPTVTAAFSGFPSPPAKANLPASFPLFSSVGINMDCDLAGTFKAVTGLPAGTFAVQLPDASVRIFVPPSTEVIIDIDPAGLSSLQALGINSAGDQVGNVATANGSGTRKLVTVSASEIVEVQLSGAATMLLCGVSITRKPNIETAPLSYSGSVAVADLAKGRWGVSLFVHALDSGVPESANVVETATGCAGLLADCTFDVA